MQVCFTHPQTPEILETGCSHTVPHNYLQEIMIIFSQKKLSKKEEFTYAKLFNGILSHICTHTLEGRK